MLKHHSFLDDDAVADVVGEIFDQDDTKVAYLLGHGESFAVNEIPAHAGAREHENQTEKHDELGSEADKASWTARSNYRDLRDVPARLRAWIRDVEHRSGVEDIFWSGNPAFAVRRELAPRAGETTIQKTTFGAFNGSNIDQVLRLLGIETLVITGISTNACVETTARDAADRGYACVIVDEATADYDEQARDAALRGFHFNFGRVAATVDDVVAALDSESDL